MPIVRIYDPNHYLSVINWIHAHFTDEAQIWAQLNTHLTAEELNHFKNLLQEGYSLKDYLDAIVNIYLHEPEEDAYGIFRDSQKSVVGRETGGRRGGKGEKPEEQTYYPPKPLPYVKLYDPEVFLDKMRFANDSVPESQLQDWVNSGVLDPNARLMFMNLLDTEENVGSLGDFINTIVNVYSDDWDVEGDEGGEDIKDPYRIREMSREMKPPEQYATEIAVWQNEVNEIDRARLAPDGLEGEGRPQLKLLELFKGTGSVGKIAKKMGMTVMSVDIESKYLPDITADILDWDYKKFHKETGFTPDLVWASPPCNTFSTLAYRLKERNTKTATPYSKRAKQGTAILHRTLEIIDYFKKQNSKLMYVIENPRAMMRYDSKIQDVPFRDTTLYCLYNDPVRRKPTDFFNNVDLNLKSTDTPCPTKELINTANLPLNKRYAIPPKLVKTILTRMVEKYRE